MLSLQIGGAGGHDVFELYQRGAHLVPVRGAGRDLRLAAAGARQPRYPGPPSRRGEPLLDRLEAVEERLTGAMADRDTAAARARELEAQIAAGTADRDQVRAACW